MVVTTLPPGDEAGSVIAEHALALRCPVVVNDAGEGATIEDANAGLAGAVLDALGRKGVRAATGATVGAPLLDGDTRARARLVGRMERFTLGGGPRPLPVVLDGAHVPFNIAAVLSDLGRAPDLGGPCVAVVALARDKDADGFLAELAARAATIVCTTVPSATRGRPALELQSIAASLGIAAEVGARPEARVRPRDGARRALRRVAARDGVALPGGRVAGGRSPLRSRNRCGCAWALIGRALRPRASFSCPDAADRARSRGAPGAGDHGKLSR